MCECVAWSEVNETSEMCKANELSAISHMVAKSELSEVAVKCALSVTKSEKKRNAINQQTKPAEMSTERSECQIAKECPKSAR